jgi:uncharacterized protein YjgD (DUF1641 family)
MMGALWILGTPEAAGFVEHMAGIPGKIDMSNVEAIGPMDMFRAMKDEEVRKGLAILMQLTKAMAQT